MSIEYNKPLTIGRLKEEIKDIPDDVFVNINNDKGESTANIYVHFENLQTRRFVELMGFKPYYAMNDEEKKKCGIEQIL